MSNTNAGLYRCTVITDGARCASYGATRRWTTLDASGNAVAALKADPSSKQRAFCDEHAVVITQGRALTRRGVDAATVPAGWLADAEREALRQCDPARWHRLAFGAARIGTDLADDLQDARRYAYAKIVATRAAVRADLSPRDAVALGTWQRTCERETARYGDTVTLDDCERMAMVAHVNIPTALAVDFTTRDDLAADTASTEPADMSALGWDADVLDMLDPAHRATLLAFAASTEPDGVEPTRNQAGEWTRGVMIPRTCDDVAVKVAALAYLTAKMSADAYAAA